MFSIYKYQLDITDKQIIELPYGAIPLSVVNQRETICLYARVNPEPIYKEKIKFEIYIHGTGHLIEEQEMFTSDFLGTVVLMAGSLVFHIFIRRI